MRQIENIITQLYEIIDNNNSKLSKKIHQGHNGFTYEYDNIDTRKQLQKEIDIAEKTIQLIENLI